MRLFDSHTFLEKFDWAVADCELVLLTEKAKIHSNSKHVGNECMLKLLGNTEAQLEQLDLMSF